MTGESDKPAKGKICVRISFQRLRVLGKSPRREEIIVIQYDDGVSCARRNAEIEGGRFSFILLTKVAYRFSKCRCDTPGIVRGPVVDDQNFPISVRLRRVDRLPISAMSGLM